MSPTTFLFVPFSPRAQLARLGSTSSEEERAASTPRTRAHSADLRYVAAFSRTICDDEAILFDISLYHGMLNVGLTFRAAVERARSALEKFGIRGGVGRGQRWEVALSAAKVENFRFRDLRHTFASWLVQRGRTLKEIQEALGHAARTHTLSVACPKDETCERGIQTPGWTSAKIARKLHCTSLAVRYCIATVEFQEHFAATMDRSGCRVQVRSLAFGLLMQPIESPLWRAKAALVGL